MRRKSAMVQLMKMDGSKNHLDKMVKLYYLVWAKNDGSIYDRFLRHTTYQGYSGFLLINDDGELVGFTYGYTSLPGQYYHGLLEKELNPESKEQWLSNCFELVELAVHPSYRNQGLGKMLATKLVEGSGHKNAILTTQVTNDTARNMYEGLGWVAIKEPFFPDIQGEAFVIMGRKKGRPLILHNIKRFV